MTYGGFRMFSLLQYMLTADKRRDIFLSK